MKDISVTAEEALRYSARSRRELSDYFLEKKIRKYSEKNPSGCPDDMIFNSLLESISIYYTLEDKVGKLFRDENGRKFAGLYALNVAGRQGLSHFCNESEEETSKVIDAEDNIFWSVHKMDLNGISTQIMRSFLNSFVSVIENGYNKPLDGVITDLYGHMVSETTKYSGNPSFSEMHKALKENPFRHKNSVFNGFQGLIKVGKKISDEYSWSMMAGYENIKEEFENIIYLIENHDNNKRYWSDVSLLVPNIILEGPTGTGKSTSARIFGSIMQSRFGAEFTEINFGNIADSYVNGAAKRLASFIDQAEEPLKKNICRFSVLYVDEIDALSNKNMQGSHFENYKIQNVLKARLGKGKIGNQHPGLVFVGSTNHANYFPPEMIRRFRIIKYGLPSEETQAKIYQHFFDANASQLAIAGDIDYCALAKHSTEPNHGNKIRLSAGHMENIVNMAVLKKLGLEQKKTGTVIPIDTNYMHDRIEEYKKTIDVG